MQQRLNIILLTVVLFCGLSIVAHHSANGQATVIIDQVKNACGASNNGSFRITVTAGTGPFEVLIFGPSTFYLATIPLTLGVPEIVGMPPPASDTGLPPDNFFVAVNDGDTGNPNFSTNVLIASTPVITGVNTTVVDNSDCTTPNGSITINNVVGGSGTYTFAWTGPGAFTSTLQNISGLAGGDYIVSVTDAGANCSFTSAAITVNDPVPNAFSISSPDANLCSSETLIVEIDNTDNGVTYDVMEGAAVLANDIGDGSSNFQISVPGLAVGNHTIRVRAAFLSCTPIFNDLPNLSVTVNPLPTITASAGATACSGITFAILTYSATTGSPDQFSLDFDLTAEGAGFVDVVNDVLPASPIVITVPGAATPGTYNALLTVRNSVNGCVSSASTPITVTVVASPTITLGPNPAVCSGTTVANLTYTATTESPNQYSIDFNGAANAAGFVDIVNAALPASPIVITVPGAAAPATYNANLTVRNSGTGCVSSVSPITVTINPNPTITLGPNPTVCQGSTSANLTYSSTTGSPDQYSIDFNAAAQTAGFVDVVNAAFPASPIVITVPGAAAAGTYNATLTVRNTTTGCLSASSTPISVTIVGNPTITLGPNPEVCAGITSANLTYTATTGSPNQYSIDFDAAAQTAGFADVVNAALPASPIVIAVPGAAAPATYNAMLTVRNSGTGCISIASPITVTINPNPTITLGPNPSVCSGATSANLTYSATTGSPNQYTLDFDAAAQTAGFADVVNAALPASPIVITVPGAAAVGTYNATLTVRNTVTGCVSSASPVSVTINTNPTITLGANPEVCFGILSANLTYSATTGSPDQYSLDFDGLAQAAGFADVVNAALPLSPIVITIPGTAAAGTYNGILTVRDSGTGCVNIGVPITVTINPNPTITLGPNPEVCSGVTSANLTYSATSGSPDQYVIDFDGAAEAAGFTDVGPLAIPASPIVITVPGAAADGTYNAFLTVINTTTLCSSSNPITVTINPNPTITLGSNPTVCAGTTSANLTYSATTGSPTQYSIDFDAAAQTAGFADVINAALPASPIVITVPGAAAAGTYNATLTVRNNATGCVSSSAAPISVTIIAAPTITLGPNPAVCSGSISASLTYSATTGVPDQYSIDFNVAAEAEGFVDVVNAALPASPIVIVVPGGGTPGVYSASLTVRNSGTGCSTIPAPITITINPNPTITLGPNPVICSGVTSANLSYSATTGSPNQFSIDFDAAAEAEGFVDVVNAALPASPIVITVPSAAATGTYNATLTVFNAVTNCVSTASPITITINLTPTITLGANPAVCSGTTSANLTYSATTGIPDQYSIDFDAAAETAGFIDVVNAAFPASPIIITVPAAAAVGTYNAILTVRNSGASCTSLPAPVTVTINPNPTITLGANPSVCSGIATANLTYSATTGTPDQFSIDFDAAAEAEGFVDVVNAVLPATPIAIAVPGGAATGVYNASITVLNTTTGCVSTPGPITITINENPTITLGANPVVCAGTNANLTYSATTGSPDQYSIDFDAAAEVEGFVDVVNAALPASPIVITVPGGAAPGIYNAAVIVRISGTGCVSGSSPITITINPNPTITLGVNPSVCSGITSANLTYSATTGTPDEYSIDFNAAAEGQGFTDVGNTALPASPIAIAIPGAAVAGVYNATFTVRNSGTGCFTVTPITVTINPNPTITLGANPVTCSGSTSTNLTYSAATGSPNRYSIDFDAAAETAGFSDIVSSVLPATPIVISVPGAATPGVYNAALTVANNTTGCGSASSPITITVNPIPTITPGANPVVCSGFNTTLTYSATTNSPDQYSIDFDGTAQAQGFADVVNAALPSSPITITVPGAAAAGIYNATLTVRISATGCVSIAAPITVTVNPRPTITLGTNPSVCRGETTASLTYSATTGSPDQYSIDFDAAAETAGFADIVNGGLTASPIAITVPGVAAAGTYNAILTVRNNTTGCVSSFTIISITINPVNGDQTTFGNQTWIGYVYNDASIIVPPVTNVDYASSRYRGFITETDIDVLPFSSYDLSTDEFDQNLSNFVPLSGTNLCGTYQNNFGIRYKMQKTLAAGVYTFTLGSDDGARLLINNNLEIDDFTLHSYRTRTATVCLPAGTHDFVIEYFERGGFARLTFDYQLAAAPDVTSPVAACINSPAPTLTASSTDPSVTNFNWYKGAALVFTGASYTPNGTDLDMTTVGSTTFTVRSVYACGENPQAATVVVDVVSAATITMNDPDVCESGGVVDLRTFVDESPAGGAFTFSGHPNISGFNFDPTGLAGSTIPITVNYSIGSCAATPGTLNVTITNAASITVPASIVQTCESAPDIDLTTLVTATPAGSSLVFAGTQVTGNLFDPSGLSGLQTITVDYSVGGCVAPQRTFQVNVNTTASMTTTNTTVCQNAASVNLVPLVTTSPAGGLLSFSGTGVSGNTFNPAGQSGVIIITVLYDANGCTANGAIQINVLSPTDPLCTGGGGTGNCATVAITPKPYPATCTNSDGRIAFLLNPFIPAVNNEGVIISIDGVSTTNQTIARTQYNDSTFEALPIGVYDFVIVYGDSSCMKTGQVTIDQSGTVGTPVVSNIVGPTCEGASTGTLTLSVPGETGNMLEWSLDAGITDPFKPFTAGGQITGIPAGPAPSFEHIISVRRNSTDPCYASVSVIIQDVNAPITATFGITSATCNGNDGSITNIVAGGGSGSNYQFSINAGQNFQAINSFSALTGGIYTLTVQDGTGCEKDFTANVTFPGFINATITKSNADCSNEGNSGSITVTINDPGVYQVALSTDQFNAPADTQYQNYSNPSVSYTQLARGQYFIYMKSNSAACPTRSAPLDISGIFALSFDIQPQCSGADLSISLTNITGEPNTPFEVWIYRKFTSTVVESFPVASIPVTGSIFLDHDDHPFLGLQDEYQIQLVQVNQVVFCEIRSALIDFTVPSPLFAQVGEVKESYPDIASGSFEIVNISGGLFPYDIRIELDSASSVALPSFETDWEELSANNSQQFEKVYENVPPGRYTIQITDSVGCSISLTARVPLDNDIFIPNIFTPNDDGANDVFYIRNLATDGDVKLTISNRWGKKVFTTDNYQNNWSGEGAADGIYFYQLKISNGDPVTGWVEIIRGQKP